jgi:hypothetical protein
MHNTQIYFNFSLKISSKPSTNYAAEAQLNFQSILMSLTNGVHINFGKYVFIKDMWIDYRLSMFSVNWLIDWTSQVQFPAQTPGLSLFTIISTIAL